MAKSGTIIGPKSGTRPFLELDWSILNQEVNNNRSRVRLTLYLRVTHSSIGYSARYTGRLQGASFTSSSGYISTSGRFKLTQRDIWVNHNSNGSKTETFSADYNLNMRWSGTYYGNITLSGNGTLDPIPRASSLSAFSFRYTLQVSTSNEINYTVDRKSGSFRHQIQLRDGSHVIQTWDNVSSDGASTLTLSDSKVNEMLRRMSNSATKSFTLRVATRSGVGGGWIGSAVTRNATATINSNVKPTANSISTSISGSGRDKAINKYVQGVSRVYASFSGSAGYGATVSSYRIQVRRKSGGANSQLINASSGTTTNPVSLHGVYEAIGTVTDSRGRTDTSRTEFAVEAYSPPSITSFTAVRNSTTATTVNTTRSGTHTPLGGNNTLSIYVQRRTGTGAWSNLTSPTSTSASFTGNYNSTGNNIALSYGFRLLIRDTFGNEDSEIVGVSTQRVVLDIHKNEGVGIGKIHEKGVLDVDGGAYFLGGLYVDGISVDKAQSFMDIHPTIMLDTIRNWQLLPHGYYFVRPGNIQGQPEPYGVIEVMKQGNGTSDDYNIIWYSQGSGPIYRKSGNGGTMTGWVKLAPEVEYGSNSNGEWIRFASGEQICWNRTFTVPYERNTRLEAMWTFPQRFIANATVIGNRDSFHGSGTLVGSSLGTGQGTSNAQIRLFAVNGTYFSAGNSATAKLMAIGRWK